MTSNHFRIDEQSRTIRERGQNGHPRTVASYPPTMTARQAREALGLYEMLVQDVPGAITHRGQEGQSAQALRRAWVRAAINFGFSVLA